jgi:hypothetical protein
MMGKHTQRPTDKPHEKPELIDGVTAIEVAIWFVSGFLTLIVVSPDVLNPLFKALK